MTKPEDLTPEVREFLAALRDLLDVPFNEDVADNDARKELVTERRIVALSMVEAALVPGRSLEVVTETARELMDQYPVTYRLEVEGD